MLKGLQNCLIVGISGATCSGKTTLANALHKVIPNSIALNQDQYYWDDDSENHILAEGIKHINWELVSAFDNERLVTEIKSLASKSEPLTNTKFDIDRNLQRFETLVEEARNSKHHSLFSHDVVEGDQIVDDMQKLFSAFPRIIILDGILIFNYPELLNICDSKFFFTLDYKTCLERRTLRSYDPPDVPGYFEKIVYPFYVKNLEDMKSLDSEKTISFLDGGNDLLSNFKIIGSNIIKTFESNK